MLKLPELRPGTFQILGTKFIKQTIKNFLDNKGKINEQSVPIKQYKLHK